MDFKELLRKEDPTVNDMFMIFLTGVATGIILIFTLLLIRDGSAVILYL